ncbi:GRAM domain-containing protein [Psidium guajava]|nr:GRAM domain-containing protein [Psidium guajava]
MFRFSSNAVNHPPSTASRPTHRRRKPRLAHPPTVAADPPTAAPRSLHPGLAKPRSGVARRRLGWRSLDPPSPASPDLARPTTDVACAWHFQIWPRLMSPRPTHPDLGFPGFPGVGASRS